MENQAYNIDKCPKCNRDLLDLSDAGFNPEALEKEQTCYKWGKGGRMFTCNNPETKTSGSHGGCCI